MAYGSYEIFDEAARDGSFIRAAEVMHLTPSAVSHSVNSLEDELGFRLFHRSRSGVTLTREGEVMLGRVRDILAAEKRFREDADRIRGLESGTVCVGTFSSILMTHLPKILQSFQKQYPGIQVRVLQGDYADVQRWVRTGEADLGFTTLPAGKEFSGKELIRDPLRLVARAGYVPGNGACATADEIAGQKLILRRRGYNADAENYIHRYLNQAETPYYIDDDRSIFALAEKGMGVSLLPELTLSHIGFHVSIWPVKPEEYRRIGLVWPASAELSPAAGRLKEFIVDYFHGMNEEKRET